MGQGDGPALGPDANADTGGAEAGAGDKPDGAAAMLGHLDSSVVADAVKTAMSSYHRNASTGDIWCTPCDGAPVVLAAAAYTGDTSADARLLQQMRLLLGGSNDPFGTGEYSANDERNATAMYAIAKRTPRIWGQLTSAEVHLIDLIMEGTLVSDVYATADKTNASGPPVTFDGSTNSNRDWNPNYREGMIGAVIVGTEYFGGQGPTESMLATYDHAAFTASLQSAGLNNLYWTFSTYMTNPGSGAPSPETVQQGIQGYAMHGMTLGQLLQMYLYLADDTFSAKVTWRRQRRRAGILVVQRCMRARSSPGAPAFRISAPRAWRRSSTAPTPTAPAATRATRASARGRTSSTSSSSSCMATGRSRAPAPPGSDSSRPG